jgi:hypothetical protein
VTSSLTVEVVSGCRGRGVIRSMKETKNYSMRFRFYDQEGWTLPRNWYHMDESGLLTPRSRRLQRLSLLLHVRQSSSDTKISCSYMVIVHQALGFAFQRHIAGFQHITMSG